jgi:hypothetical protein
LGSSHSFRGVNPEFFDKKAYNAAYVSQPLNYDKVILENYFNSSESLHTVILPISYMSLFQNLNRENSSWRNKNYNIYYGFDTGNNLKYKLELLSLNLDVNLLRVYSGYLKSHSYLTANKMGFGSRRGQKENINFKLNAEEAVNKHTKEDFYLFDENIANLNNIISFINKKNINLILFIPPATKYYSEQLNLNQLSKTINTCRKLDKQNPKVKFVNLLNDEQFKLQDFYDADHLNDKGAKKLSEILNDLIEK